MIRLGVSITSNGVKDPDDVGKLCILAELAKASRYNQPVNACYLANSASWDIQKTHALLRELEEQGLIHQGEPPADATPVVHYSLKPGVYISAGAGFP